MIQTGPICCVNQKHVNNQGCTDDGVVIIGIAPAGQEVKDKKPFVGQNGKLLDSLLRYVSWDRSRVYLMNMICHPIKDTDPDLSLPDLQICLHNMEEQLRQIKPRLVIPVGKAACKYFTGMGVNKARGVPVFNQTRGYYVMPTFQPVAALQGDPSVIHHLVRDLAKIPMILEWPNDGSIKDVSYEVIRTRADAQRVLATIPSDTIVSLDIETDNEFVNIIDVHRDRLLCLAISYFSATSGVSQQHTYVFPRDILDGLEWPTHIKYNYQNGAFDSNGMNKYLGVPLPIDHDILLMSYALDERGGRDEAHDTFAGIHGLGPQANEYCGAEFYKDKMKPGHKKPAELDEDDLFKYNAADAGYTARLHSFYLPRLYKENVYDLYHDRLLPQARAFAEINYQGISLDRKRLQDLVLSWGPRFLEGEELLIDLAQEYGFPGRINLNSHPQLSKFLFEILGLEGGPSTRREVLEELDHPFVDKLMEHKRLDHIWKHYIIPGVQSIKVDGRMHSSTLVHGTTSGRVAYTDPPLQTLPQQYSVGEYAEIRSIYVPDDDDHVIAEFDYGQIEIWIAMGLSHDDHMRVALESGDYHSATARDVMRLPIDTMVGVERDQVRQAAKKVGFGVIYLIGPYTLSKPKTGINSTVQEAQRIIDNFYQVNSGYHQWVQDTIREARTKGELVSKFGRHRRFRLFVDPKQERQAVNFPVQSTANDYTLSALMEMHFGLSLEELANEAPRPKETMLQRLDARILWGVHDSIVMNISKKYLAETIDYVKSMMEKQWLPDMPRVKIEPKIGPNLYDVVKLSEKRKKQGCEHEHAWYSDTGLCLDCLVRSFDKVGVAA